MSAISQNAPDIYRNLVNTIPIPGARAQLSYSITEYGGTQKMAISYCNVNNNIVSSYLVFIVQRNGKGIFQINKRIR